jgi:drug/metabolite transporter (DMT)-like permease
MRPGKLKIFIFFALVCFIWGSTWLGIKLGLEGVPPLLGAGVRFAVAGMLFLLLILSQRLSLKVNPSGLRLIAVVGGMNFGLSYGCVYWSELHIASGLASVLFCVYPFFVALLAYYWYGLEELTWRRMAGITVGFLGIVVIYADQAQRSGQELRGMLAVLLAALASAVSLVYLKKHGQALNTLVMNFYSMLLGSALLLAGASLLERGQPIHWSARNISAMLYLAVFGSVVAFSLYFYLLKHLRATQMSFVSLICPILALLLGAWALQEKVTYKILIGAALVLVGIFIANRERSASEAQAP